MRTKPILSGLAVLAISVQACGPLPYGSGKPIETSHSMDSVKLIAPEITDTADPSTFLQDQYTITKSHRLLMRFEELRDHSGQVLTDGESVYLAVTAVQPTRAQNGVDSLQLCYLTRNWMMRATWWKAHPYGGDLGNWAHPGADYTDCVKAQAEATETGTIKFDVTDWFKNDVQDRSTNYGFILIGSNSDAVTIYGENSTTYSPRMLWKEY